MDFKDYIQIIIEIATLVGTIVPIIISLLKIANGMKCQLRTSILKVYYKHYKTDCTLKQYERENIDYLYNAYKELKGNSFIDDVYKEMRNWKVEI